VAQASRLTRREVTSRTGRVTMGLSCACGDYDWDIGSWYWTQGAEDSPMPDKPRRSRCASCNTFINAGDVCSRYDRHLVLDEDSIAGRIHGESKPLASWYECEACYGVRGALEELGYCVNLGDSMKDLVAEYNETAQK